MKITIIIDGLERIYNGGYEELHTKDWNQNIQEHLDDAKEFIENPFDETPPFEGTYEALEKLTIL